MKEGTMCIKGPVDPGRRKGNNRIRDLRMKMGLTQADLANLVGCHRITITNLELDGHMPKNTLAERIADVCGVSVSYVMGETEDTPYTSMKTAKPESRGYYVVAYHHSPQVRWKSYCVAFWNGKLFQRVKSGMQLEPIPFEKDQVTDWMLLPIADTA